jgi:peroxiredoxin Q/BCP
VLESTRRRLAHVRPWWPVIVTMALVLGWKGETVSANDLAVGDPAPEFSLPGSDGRTHALASYRGKQVVVLAWFPKAFTGG